MKKVVLIMICTALIGFTVLFIKTAPAVKGSSGIDIRGTITHTQQGSTNQILGTVLIEGTVEKDTRYDKASVTVTGTTKIYMMRSGKKVSADFSSLSVGQKVEAAFTGPVRESYPVQATAMEIIILE
jgi:hypothetical protein